MNFSKDYSKKSFPLERVQEEFNHMVAWESHLKEVPADSKGNVLHFSQFIIDLSAVVLDLYENCIRVNSGEDEYRDGDNIRTLLTPIIPDKPKKEDFSIHTFSNGKSNLAGYNYVEYAKALEAYIDLWIK